MLDYGNTFLIYPPLLRPVGCDDLVNAVFELAKSMSRLQLTEEEMALFSAVVLFSPGLKLNPISKISFVLQHPDAVALQKIYSTCTLLLLLLGMYR